MAAAGACARPGAHCADAEVLGTRHRPLPVFTGVAAGFAVHTCLAVVAGGLLSLLPQRPLHAVVAALAITGGRGLLRVIPQRLVSLLAAAAMVAMAAVSVIGAIGLQPLQPPPRG
jgi:putative Ca2+/H+ antiporter (TMEM165/GDT1 family)